MYKRLIATAFLAGSLAFMLAALVVAQYPAADTETKPYTPHIAPASKEGVEAIKRIRLPKDFKVELWAAEPMLANPVCLAIDGKNRIYVAETFRLHDGVTDIRGHMDWLDDDLACRTVDDRVAMLKRREGDKIKNYSVHYERIRLLEDTTGTGKADKATVFADGFHNIPAGIGAGLLARGDTVWYACIPDLWMLRDTKGTGKADERKVLHTGFGIHVGYLGHDLHGLRMGPDGKLYFSLGDRGSNVKTDKQTFFYPDTGAVYRCNLDGSDLELYATGLRNPQELTFDQYGNLFTGDNNSDAGDQVRWTYLVEGGDSGWRIGYQFGTNMGVRGPFMAEELWKPHFEGQAAYIVPPIANIGDGPSGVTYYPGMGLPQRYDGHFFMCDFRGAAGQSGVRSFALKPQGATFEMVDREEFIWSVLATDVDFGMDGAIYLTDWVDGWDKPHKGRIYKVSDPDLAKSPEVQEVKKLMAEGMEKRSTDELAGLMAHKDMRVRLEAQYALAAKGGDAIPILKRVATESKSQMARLHAIWGLGQIGRTDVRPYKEVVRLADHADPEVRAQAAKVLGDGKYAEAFENLVALLKDREPRVQFFAAQGLGRLAKKEATAPVLAMLRANNDHDQYLRHAGVMALLGANDHAALAAAADDSSAAVRLAVLLVYRRQGNPDVAHFLNDPDPRLAGEAARAINDVPIEAAFPQLAALMRKTGLSNNLLYRVVNVNFRLGKPQNAEAVAAFAARSDVPEALRLDALNALNEWTKPHGRDRVMGLWRPLDPRPEKTARDAVKGSLGGIFTGSDKVRQEATKLAASLGIKEVGPVLMELAADTKRSPQVRVETLRALQALKDPNLTKAMDLALKDREPHVRNEGRRLLAKVDPSKALQELTRAVESGDMVERQGAFRTLGDMNTAAADSLLAFWLGKLLDNQLAPEAHLDLLEAAAKRPSAELKDKLAQFNKARPKNDDLANYREALQGGDADNGRRLFFYKSEVYCLRCHKVEGQGGDVGPDLTGIGTRQKREYLLESIVLPNKQIAKGFETVVLTLKNGKSVVGILKGEDDKEVRLMTAEGKLLAVAKAQIDERQTGKSAMPEDIAKYLSKSDLRDLVEFLAELKQK
jgi:quinoprotein glucose dehydrogenase